MPAATAGAGQGAADLLAKIVKLFAEHRHKQLEPVVIKQLAACALLDVLNFFNFLAIFSLP